MLRVGPKTYSGKSFSAILPGVIPTCFIARFILELRKSVKGLKIGTAWDALHKQAGPVALASSGDGNIIA
jgi:hypothetical protein